MIQIRHFFKLARIKVKLWRRLAQITVAGWLIKLAFRISPDVMRQMGYRKNKPQQQEDEELDNEAKWWWAIK